MCCTVRNEEQFLGPFSSHKEGDRDYTSRENYFSWVGNETPSCGVKFVTLFFFPPRPHERQEES